MLIPLSLTLWLFDRSSVSPSTMLDIWKVSVVGLMSVRE